MKRTEEQGEKRLKEERTKGEKNERERKLGKGTSLERERMEL